MGAAVDTLIRLPGSNPVQTFECIQSRNDAVFISNLQTRRNSLQKRVIFLVSDCSQSQGANPLPPLVQERLQTFHSINNSSLQRPPLYAQHLGCLRVINQGQLVLGRQLATLGVLRGQLVLELGEVLPHKVKKGFVAKVPGGSEQAAAAQVRLLKSIDVGLGDVAHIYPRKSTRVGQDIAVRLPLALHKGHDALVGRVDAIQAGEVVHDGAENQRWVHSDQIKLGLAAALDKVPGGLFGERLGRAVGHGRVLVDVGDGDGVPAFLGEGGVRVGEFADIQDGGEGGSHNYALDGGGGFGDGFEDAYGAVDGGVDQVLLGIGWGRMSVFIFTHSSGGMHAY